MATPDLRGTFRVNNSLCLLSFASFFEWRGNGADLESEAEPACPHPSGVDAAVRSHLVCFRACLVTS